MYPARWFPVNDYTVDRFTTDLKVTVPAGYRVIASGARVGGRGRGWQDRGAISDTPASFPGSIAVVQGDPTTVIASGGVTTALYFRGAERHGRSLRRGNRRARWSS